jgi:hypothetical protein
MRASVCAAHSSVAVGVGEGLGTATLGLGAVVALAVSLGAIAAGGALHATRTHGIRNANARTTERARDMNLR